MTQDETIDSCIPTPNVDVTGCLRVTTTPYVKRIVPKSCSLNRVLDNKYISLLGYFQKKKKKVA